MTSKAEKQKRMDLRRKVGARSWGAHFPPSGPRLGVSRITYACFMCRIAVKKPRTAEAIEVCGRCGGSLYEMGWSFKAPRKTQLSQWKKVQFLYAHGFRFFGSGSVEDVLPLPASLPEAKRFVVNNPKHRLKLAEFNPELLP